jgi:hypothetical protein
MRYNDFLREQGNSCGADSDPIGGGFIAVLCGFAAATFSVQLQQFRNSP